MNLTKTTLAALLSTLSLSAAAADDLSFYGKANVTVQSNDEGDGSYTEVKSNASRLGVKGSHKIDENLEVVFQAEFQVDLDGDDDTFTDRNQFIGLKGSFGEVLLGKNDTMLKQSQGKIDLFSDLDGDIKSLWKGENRMDDTITYKSPSFNGIKFGITYIAEDSSSDSAKDATSLAIIYGDEKLKKSNFFASAAIDSEVKGYDATRISVQGKISDITLGAMYQTQENVSSGAELDGFMVSAKYSLDKVTLKGQIQTAEEDGGDDKSGYTVGADYKLSSQAKLFAFYTSFDMDSKADKDYLAAGIEYSF